MGEDVGKAAEAFERLKKGVVYGIVLAVVGFLAVLMSLFVSASLQSVTPFAVALSLFVALSVVPAYFVFKGFLGLSEFYDERLYRYAAWLTLGGAVAAAVAAPALAWWAISLAESRATPPDLSPLRWLAWPVGVLVGVFYMRVFLKLAEDSGVDLFKAVGVVALLSGLLSPVDPGLLPLVELILLYMAASRGEEAVYERAYSRQKQQGGPTV